VSFGKYASLRENHLLNHPSFAFIAAASALGSDFLSSFLLFFRSEKTKKIYIHVFIQQEHLD
jgi:hypothetical protein